MYNKKNKVPALIFKKRGSGVRRLLSLSVILLAALMSSPVFSEGSGELKIVLENVRNNKGKINIALCSSEEQYSSDAEIFKTVSIDAKEPVAEYTFRDIVYGRYAVKVYHDANGNNKLDKGLFGIPKESYGFSNNPRIKGGMPPFEETVFQINSPVQAQNIKLR